MTTNEARLAAAPVVDWLLSTECRALGPAELAEGFAAALASVGVPLWRMSTSLRTLHPEVWIVAVRWRRDTGAIIDLLPHALAEDAAYTNSPVAAIHGGVDVVRRRLVGADAQLDYPVCRDLAADGGADYLCLAIPFAGPRSFVSFATDAPGGFSDAHVALLEAVRPALTTRLELEAEHQARRGLLEVYLGRLAAARVMAGRVDRGHGESIRAALWTCDLRDYTALSDGADPQAIVGTLDEYFDCTAGAVVAAGGDVLKFVGDAVLAIFPCGDDEAAARRSALGAARDALARLHDKSGGRLRCGVGLHVGDVFFGNIGAGPRLDFTVIGAAVNTASRVESATKGLGVDLLMTADFAAPGLDVPVVSKGLHALKGVAQPVELFTLGP